MVLEVRNVTKRFGSLVAVRDVSLQVRKGAVLCMWNPLAAPTYPHLAAPTLDIACKYPAVGEHRRTVLFMILELTRSSGAELC